MVARYFVGLFTNEQYQFYVVTIIILQMVKKLRESFRSGKTRKKSFRIQQLKNLLRMLDEREDEITEAGHRDLRKVNLLMCNICIVCIRSSAYLHC